MQKNRFLKYCFIVLALAVCLVSCKKNNNNSVSIKGDINKLEFPFILLSYISNDTLAIDTIKSKSNGHFSHKIKVDTLTMLSLYFNEQQTSVSFFVDKGDKIKIGGDADLTDLIHITGNEINNEITAFKEKNKELLKQRSYLIEGIKKLSPDYTGSNVGKLTDNDEIARLNAINKQLLINTEEFIKENPTKTSSLILISNFFSNAENPAALARTLDYITGDVKNSQLGLNLKAFSEKINRSAEGSPMPYFEIKDINGKLFTPSSFIGKHLLLSFVSSKNNQSREIVKSLKKTYEKLPKDSIEFVTIYIDSDTYPISYIENDSIAWTVIAEKKSWASDIVDAFNIQFTPNNILISPKGIISQRNILPSDIEKRIKNG